MTWHYTLDGQQRGPVDDEEFQRLVGQGVINRTTLVWREGMAEWIAYDGMISSPPPVSGPQVACTGCGRPTPLDDTVEIRGLRYCAACKPMALQRLMGGTNEFNSPAEEIRKLHIKHEASVKSVGTLYYLGSVALLFLGAAMVIAGFSSGAKPENAPIGAVFLGLAVFQFFVARGLRRLRPGARTAAGILAGIGLLGIPLGTLINGYILYLLFSKKGTTVFSPEYQEVIRQTPDIKYKTSIVVWIVLGLLLLVLASIIGFAVLSSH